MGDGQSYDPFDDLDAFFSAAASDDGDALQQAAEHVAGNTKRIPKPVPDRQPAANTEPSQKAGGKTSVRPRPLPEDPKTTDEPPAESLEGKFIAIDPAELPGADEESRQEPFILIPAHIHSFLPWWAWATIGLGLLVTIVGVAVMPAVTLNRVAARLGDDNAGVAQSAMRQLVVRGDERTVNTLLGIASSRENRMAARLRAVDTLGLMHAPGADRALLRLELAGNTDAQIREAAIAARKQREASRTRERKP